MWVSLFQRIFLFVFLFILWTLCLMQCLLGLHTHTHTQTHFLSHFICLALQSFFLGLHFLLRTWQFKSYQNNCFSKNEQLNKNMFHNFYFNIFEIVSIVLSTTVGTRIKYLWMWLKKYLETKIIYTTSKGWCVWRRESKRDPYNKAHKQAQ